MWWRLLLNQPLTVQRGDKLTALHFEAEGVLLLDGVGEDKTGIAAVVCAGVLGQDAGEVEVSIEPHGHAGVLLDSLHVCGNKDRADSEEEMEMEGEEEEGGVSSELEKVRKNSNE